MRPSQQIISKANLMLRIILPVIILFTSCKYTSSQKKFYNQSDTENFFQIKRGVNISHWLSQNPDKSSNRKRLFTLDDVALIAKLGYDHVRIPVEEEHLWNEDGTRMNTSFEMLNGGIGWCLKNKLKVILDLHQVRSHQFNNKDNLLWKSRAAQEQFIRMWLCLSDEFSKYPVEEVAYELLNEAVADSSIQ
jgi:endoglucanase